MNETQYILFFLGGLGAFNGLVLGIYLMIRSRAKNLPTFFLGCLLLVLSIRIGKSVFLYFTPLPAIYRQIGLSACFLIGPALYYFVRSTLEQRTQFPRLWKWQIGSLLGIILLTGILFRYAVFPETCNKYTAYVIYGEWSLYMIVTALVLRRQWAKLFTSAPAPAAGLTNPEKWLLAIYTGNFLIFLAFQLSLYMPPQYDLYFSGALIFSFLFYLVVFVLLYRRKTNDLFNLVPVRSSVKKRSDQDAAPVLKALDQLMMGKEIYKNPNLTLAELAKAVNLTSHQLSQVLNENLGKNFTSFINEYRIDAACKMIAANHPFSLEAVGYEVGFNSKSTFYTSFKKIRGTTPLLYKEQLEKSEAS